MKLWWCVLTFVTFIFSPALCTTPKTVKPGENDACAKFCRDTYSPHTSEQSTNAKACDQGCSLYSMLQFSGDKKEEKIREQCTDACGKAFVAKPNLKDACQAGCKHQSPFTNGHMEIVIDNKNPLFKYAQGMFDGMFDGMRNMRNRLMGSMNGFWNNHDTFEDDFNDPGFDDMEKEMAKMHKEMQNMMSRFWDHPRHQGMIMNGFGNRYGMHHRQREPGMMIEIGDQHDRTGTMDSLDPKPHEPSPPVDARTDIAYDPEASWVACLARRARRLSAMTRWLLCLALFLCILCMVWICLAIIRTAPKRRILVTKGAPIQVSTASGDMEKKFLVENGAPLVHSSPPPPYEEKPPMEA